MRKSWLLFFVVVLTAAAMAEPAFAQAANPYNVSWAALNPGNDWAAQVIQSLFPIGGTTASPGTSPGQETTVIQSIVGQFTGFVGAIACAFVAYTTIMNIHRAAESARVLGQGQSWMFVVRVGFAGIMMFPLGGGFSAGQALVMQAAMTGVGMAKAVYANAIQAVGPDAAVIATADDPRYSINRIRLDRQRAVHGAGEPSWEHRHQPASDSEPYGDDRANQPRSTRPQFELHHLPLFSFAG